MKSILSRRALLTGGLSALAGAAVAEAPLRALRPLARPLIQGGPRAPGVRPVARIGTAEMIAEARLGGTVGFALADLRTGRVIEAADAGVPMPPASVTKAITTMYALDALGPAHRFGTRLMATGPVTGGVLEGDLILAGGGDPVLDTDDLGDLAAALRQAGVTSVTGGFRVWGRALPNMHEIDPSQLNHLGYNPAVSGLNLNFNRVYFEWARNGGTYAVSMDARSERYRPDVTTARMRVVDRSLPVYTYADADGVDDWTVARSALGDGGSRWLPVRRPALYAAEVFRTLALAQGVTLPQAAEILSLPPGAVALAGHDSDPLDQLARDMLLYSTNLTAETLGLAASNARGARPASLAASGRVMTEWAEVAMGCRGHFVDHSGLGDASRISAGEMVKALVSPGPGAQLRPLLKDIALLDASGNVLADAPAQVVAKTGTLNFVSALAGYVRTAGGADLAFAIFCANPDARDAAKDAGDEVPEGAAAWNGRAKRLQQRLLQRWGLVHHVCASGCRAPTRPGEEPGNQAEHR